MIFEKLTFLLRQALGTIKQEDRLTESMTARMSGFMKPAKLQYLGKKTKITGFGRVEMLKSWIIDS
jgi:hypothetical protein